MSDDLQQSPYRHTQFGGVTVAVIGLGTVLILWRGFSSGWDPVLGFVVAVLLLCLFLFHSLTVTVDQRYILIRFGSGPIRRTFPLSQVRSVESVRSRWWHGWGIRWIPGGVLYAVSGLGAVELRMTNGRVVRIGTDQPEALAAALRTRLSS